MDPYRLGLVSPRIHYFQLVARLGSVRQTAQVLNVAPSSISRLIKALEDEIGTPLFERVRQRLKLTSAGELLLYHAKVSTSELGRAWSEINDLRGLNRGGVSVTVVESVARGLMPTALKAFWERHPLITVDVRVAGSQQACDAVAEGDCQLALAFDVQVPRSVRKIAAAMLPLGVVAHPESRFAGRKELKLFDLSGERVILSDGSLALGLSVEEAISRSIIDLTRRSRTNSIGLMIELAKLNLGTVLQTRIGVEAEVADGTLIFVPLHDAKIPPRRLMLLTRPEREMSDAASAFATQLAQTVERLGNDR
ncbi:LysR family transcriptional regulator [Mesorhizobium sp. M2A.F.Ca.ET.043.05.1.1]|uniref:LysR family transcriptional regulator n=1 Tax=unclassified Mesorhizobium TaxID=325217 RepID=UPI000F75B482|nr:MULTISPECIES: LysR family transcriptional regulator [unclassified Mesorhizobium]AZO16430.1 LysR family transcriptional regulator [Mesorhizobium sp. M2A.F.Ca.ET.043.05.1.1]RUX33671.1 LysR family transcriptional regulator [Mesorhizobium sp. M2A.F.Ca.ET.042.01.1.1]TIV25584.1 MAG: LysR family transcriptional regulator [Mesorhizobium sp.]